MSNKDQINKLVKYITDLTDRLSAPTPKKHENRPNEYREFLVRELNGAKTKVEALKMEVK